MDLRASIAAACVLATLTAGCTSEPQPPSDDPPATLAPKPENPPQPKLRMDVAPPAHVLFGAFSSADADQVWEQSMRLMRRWTFNPELVQRHPPERNELDGITRLMTAEAAERWKKYVRRAFNRKPVRLGKKKIPATAMIDTLVVWQANPPKNRGWDNPMFSRADVTNGKVIAGNGELGAIFQLDVDMLLLGRGARYKVHFKTVVALVWRKVDGEWKLHTWARSGSRGDEELVSSRDTPSDLEPGASPSPSASETTRPEEQDPIETPTPITVWPS